MILHSIPLASGPDSDQIDDIVENLRYQCAPRIEAQ
jgi:tetrahydromethanopterin S-methyltransferase subunit F